MASALQPIASPQPTALVKLSATTTSIECGTVQLRLEQTPPNPSPVREALIPTPYAPAALIPDEILRSIFEESLWYNSAPQHFLAKAALVCRRWLPAASQVLYADLEMGSHLTHKLLARTMWTTPRVPPLVRELPIAVYPKDDDTLLLFGWLALLPAVPGLRLLDILVSRHPDCQAPADVLAHILVRASVVTSVRWLALEGPLPALPVLVRARNLERLWLSHCSQLPVAICSPPGLTSLSLTAPVFGLPGVHALLRSSPIFKLKVITVEYPLVPDFHVQPRIAPEVWIDLSRLLAVAGVVKELTFELPDDYTTLNIPTAHIDLCAFPAAAMQNLTSLETMYLPTLLLPYVLPLPPNLRDLVLYTEWRTCESLINSYDMLAMMGIEVEAALTERGVHIEVVQIDQWDF
ncbi:hypothetical protein EXIGLDRAFT_765502 [Exidia glandulosa HHB12029]|uniref:Uncharacterized protein n=1 Tax=Exidia glandulosa HHB12029 TaxID=1314781 RepID=A0A165KFX2_EXIGL|nr:hypothetical protein EXIGLDRAFT_765502 [Exidia glandulosa HHB12029]